MPVVGFDHVALPAQNPDALLDFYKRLGFRTIYEEEWRAGRSPIFPIAAGENAKINFHGPTLWQDAAFEARGPTARPGCGALCLLVDGPIDEAVALLQQAGAEIACGRYGQPGGGARGRREGTSAYTRDADGNLIEFMTCPAAGRRRWGG